MGGRPRGQLEAGDGPQGAIETTVVAAGESVQVRVTARNTGDVPWLASAAAGPHRVGLAWRWLEGPQGAEPGPLSGHVPLRYDVFPGQSHPFRPIIRAPARPGTYTLELSLVGDGAANLVEPMRVVMNVEPVPSLDFERLLERLKVSTADAPRIALSTEGRRYRAGDTLTLKVTGGNGEHRWSLDAYLVLRGPDGALWVRDGDVLVPYRTGPWPAAAKNIPLRARASVSAELTLPVRVTTPGPNTWFVLLTSAGTHRVVAESRVTFEVDR